MLEKFSCGCKQGFWEEQAYALPQNGPKSKISSGPTISYQKPHKCTACPAGSSCDGTGTVTPCPAGNYAPAGSFTCKPCAADQFAPAASTACKACADMPCGKSPSGMAEVRRGCGPTNPGQCVSEDDDVQFAIYDLEAMPVDRWRLADSKTINYYRAQFVKSYNANGGLNVVRPFATGNCCIALKYGKKITVSGTKYDFQFPASASGQINCNPSKGYNDAKYSFYLLPTITEHQVIGEKEACVTKHNPAVFWRPTNVAPTPAPTPVVRPDIEFGLYDSQQTPPGGWHLMSLTDIQTHKAEFVESYNKNGGFRAIKLFTAANCCIALNGGKKITISGTKYGIQFPGDKDTNAIRCNPPGGYGAVTGSSRSTNYNFFQLAQLTMQHTIGEKTACVTNHNPGLFMRMPAWHSDVEFGLYDADITPAGGWELMGTSDFNRFRAEFVKEYNAEGGLKVIEVFQSKNCCIAVKDGEKLIIEGTPYKYQFPAGADGGIRCNPTGGYKDERYQFYRTPGLTMMSKFSSKKACATNHNPGIYIRGHVAPTPAPTPFPTPSPTPAAVHCGITSWSSWTACSKTCGGGLRHRKRTVHQEAAHGGTACPTVVAETEACRVQDCAVHCSVSDFSDWSPCSAECGDGSEERKRIVMQPPNQTGDKCPHLTETRTCKIKECPVHCSVSGFGDWDACPRTCGGAVQGRERTVTLAANFDGNPCPHLRETRECGTGSCPSDCVVTTFNAWSACTVSCGGGQQERTRVVNSEPAHGGVACPALVEKRACSAEACPIDCQVSNWLQWTTCSNTCGEGIQGRTRMKLQSPAHGGKACEELFQERSCNAGPCPSHCTVSSWGGWDDCTLTCGSGKQRRTRWVQNTPAFGGYTCPALAEERTCNDAPCAVDCYVSAWRVWSTASVTCGAGCTQHRHRVVERQAAHGGVQCPVLTEQRNCMKVPPACPIHCAVTPWSVWSECDKTCEAGMQSRGRKVTVAAQYEGVPCPPLHETKPCSNGPCPLNCMTSRWYEWSQCSVSCGTGYHTRLREVEQHPAHGGYTCPTLSETRQCKNMDCPRNCAMSAWASWGSCDSSCGLGMQVRTRNVLTHPLHGGKVCPPMLERRGCVSVECPVHCVVDGWSTWTSCSVSCGVDGTRTRHRVIRINAAHGGTPCPATVENQDCRSLDHCPQHCEITGWSQWTTCSTSCGTGSQRRTRSVVKQPKFNGTPCPLKLYEFQPCNAEPCPGDCVMAPFGEWGTCDKSCGGGTHTRSRTITSPATNGGAQCGDREESRPCQTKPCPMDCVLTSWGAFGECSATCGVGSRKRTRGLQAPPRWGGKSCPTQLAEMWSCDAGPCPVHCDVSDWSQWSGCTATCGTEGKRTRMRGIVKHADHGGYVCPDLKQTEGCNIKLCPTPCVVSNFDDWSRCPTSCGAGSQTRSRSLLKKEQAGGACPFALKETRVCNHPSKCPRDCHMTEWSAFGECSRSCGAGVASRHRKIVSGPVAGGQACGGTSEFAACNTAACPTDCEMNTWSPWSACTKTCGGGEHFRLRTIKRADTYGGASCPSQQHTAPCNDFTCPVSLPGQGEKHPSCGVVKPANYDKSYFSSDGMFLPPKNVAYFPQDAIACCSAECGKQPTEAARRDCNLGCSMWLHHSSLNWECVRWHALLLKKCQRDCGAARLWSENVKDDVPSTTRAGQRQKRAGNHGSWKPKQSQIYWLTKTSFSPTDEDQCKAGCTQYHTCMSVAPIQREEQEHGMSSKLVSHGYSADQNPDVMPLEHCHGDCDNDGHCKTGYVCHQQDQKSPIPGCEGTPEEAMDYCVRTGDVAVAASAAAP
jgi:hypothetical protein